MGLLESVTFSASNKNYGFGSSFFSLAYTLDNEEAWREKMKLWLETSESRVEELKKLLAWKPEQSDEIFTLVPLDDCPKFTFLSHKWAAGGQSLGIHGELMFLLAQASCDYVWLDLACAPQDPDSFANGNCLKVIWNIDRYVAAATNVITQYTTDGLMETQAPSNDSPGFLSSGFIELCDNLGRYSSSRFADDIIFSESFQPKSLWCSVEKFLGRGKMPVKPEVVVDDSMNPVVQMETLDDELHRNNKFYLDCYDDNDVEPVSTILYSKGEFPCILTPGSYDMYVVDLNNVNTEASKRKGILLPEKVAKSETPKPRSRGWYYSSARNAYLFFCVGVRKDISIRLEIHCECLAKIKADTIEPFDWKNYTEWDYIGRGGRSPVHCIAKNCVVSKREVVSCTCSAM